MKKSNIHIPSRQSLFALAQIVYKTYALLIRQLWPILVLLAVRDGSISNITYLVTGMTIMSMIVSIIRYYRFYYHIDGDELVVKSGLLTKSVKSVPFDKIQTIDFEQNVIHKIFNVVKVKIDTAGSDKEELSMDALTIDDANLLRDYILSSKKMFAPTSGDDPLRAQDHFSASKIITSLSIPDLIKAGILENHLKSAGIILFAMVSLWERIKELNIYDDISTDDVSVWVQSVRIAMTGLVIFVVASFLFSLVRIILQYFGLTFSRVKDGFVYRAGLFTTKQVSLKDHKIQTITWSNNLLQKAFGINDVYIRHAASKEINQKKSIRIPGCSQHHILGILGYLYDYRDEYQERYLVDKAYFTRFTTYVLPLMLLAIAGLIYLGSIDLASLPLLALIPILQRYFKSKRLSVSLSGDLVEVSHGTVSDKVTIFPMHKIQAVERVQTPYQRRKKLASIILHTAAHPIKIPYLQEDEAQYLYDLVLLRVESSRKNWM